MNRRRIYEINQKTRVLLIYVISRGFTHKSIKHICEKYLLFSKVLWKQLVQHENTAIVFFYFNEAFVIFWKSFKVISQGLRI